MILISYNDVIIHLVRDGFTETYKVLYEHRKNEIHEDTEPIELIGQYQNDIFMDVSGNNIDNLVLPDSGGMVNPIFEGGAGNLLSEYQEPSEDASITELKKNVLKAMIALYPGCEVSFMDHTMHSLDFDSAVADTAENIPSRASSSSRRRCPSRGSKPLPNVQKKKVTKFSNVPHKFIHIVKTDLELSFDLRRVVNFSIMQRMNDSWKRHKSRLNKKCIKGKDLTKVKVTPSPFDLKETVKINVPDEDVNRVDVFIKARTKADKTYQCLKIFEKLQKNMNLYHDLNKIGHDDVLAKIY
ncbi:hypothetical protein GIB67_037847 [Kingdonia uniflora]|uniref:Uncharacterized protein n=1 Tax=Kingdonia uniflora TaxID=39325 RepID=A0A7J7LH59_9MAGN|nr:hypothetical protein GIB67_037847 [Kingdonia uniflora]